jgi:hypothetical protein
MSGSRGPFRYTRTGHPLDQVTLDLVVKAGIDGGWRGYASDFVVWEGPIAEGTDAGIILSGVTGAATITRPAVGNRGAIRITTEATANGNGQIEIPGQFGYVAGKRLVCFAEVVLSDEDDMLTFFGLATPGNTDFVAGLPAEGIFFEKGQAVVDWDFHVRDNATSTEDTTFSNGGLVSLQSAHIIGFEVTRTGVIVPYYGTSWLHLNAGTVVANDDTHLPDDAADELSIYVGVETGNGEADYVEVRKLIVAQEY